MNSSGLYTRKQPFTLIELLVVMVIIAILAASPQTAYPLSFAGGHMEAFKFLCGDTLSWEPSQPKPEEISRDGTPNQDLINLRNAAYRDLPQATLGFA